MDPKTPFREQPIEMQSQFLAVPLLARCAGDWATIAIINSSLKHLRRKLYKQNVVQRPAKYNYLVQNAAKRRGADREGATGSKRKCGQTPGSRKRRKSGSDSEEELSGREDEIEKEGENNDEDD
ncbi:hypothetical protein E1B28_012880 [Marasmius oreades]|uniref:Uncharacterized protein n=1 Tax=Marasmius oreades TaxID=181124 RepID=A0A9P7RSM1_9AGAR|nr:uncharacterized protein E1B28_012880 [Marasmius oreades]KAG7088935.1 hypothetical protein E1B28_012880 [Marasmius oreades]